MLKRMYIDDIKKELPFRDRRTLKKWCRNNGIGIFSDIGSNRLYVLKVEFELAKNNKEIVKYLKDKYGEERLLKIINDDEIYFEECLKTLTSKGDIEMKAWKTRNTYISRGDHEKNFLNACKLL